MRFFTNTQVKILFVFLFMFTISCVYFQSVIFSRPKTKSEDELSLFTNVLRPTKDTSIVRHVTKSLSELAKSTSLSDHILMFNRIPGSGSEIFVLILQWLQGRNNFKHIRLGGGISGKLTHAQQKDFSNIISDTIRLEAIPLSFDQSIYFTNFSQFGSQSPTYFNLVRDPIDQYLASVSNGEVDTTCWSPDQVKCKMLNSSSFQHTIPFFCGHDDNCLKLNNKWALKKAKENVERFFPVVGVLENVNETLLLLENKLSFFFKGAQKIYSKKMTSKKFYYRKYLDICSENVTSIRNYYANKITAEFLINYLFDPLHGIISGSRKKWKQKMYSKDVETELKTVLSAEYDFYYWIKARLFDQIRIYTSNNEKKSLPKHHLVNFQIEQP